MKILLVDTSYPINSRNLRIVNSLSKAFGSKNVKYATWLRDNREIQDEDKDNLIFKLFCPLGDTNGKLKNLLNYKKFLKHSIDIFEPDVIIASHWDCLFLCASIKKKGQILIYENLDMPSGGNLKFKILRYIEKICLKRVSAIIFASRFFMPYYENFNGEKILLENLIPNELKSKITHINDHSKDLIITFNGTLRYPLMLENLFAAVGDMEGVRINLYGYGVGQQAERIYHAAKPFKNINFFGPYKYTDIPKIYSNTDIVWAVYPSHDFNVRVAISNKFHESVFFQVPGIFAQDTCLGQLVKDKGIGFQVDGYSISEIRKLISYIKIKKEELINETRRKMELMKIKESILWDDSFRLLSDYLKSNIDV